MKINLVKSAYVKGGHVITLEHYDLETKYISCPKLEHRWKQRIFVTNSFGAQKKPMFSFILVQEEDSNTQCVWVAKAVALLRTSFGNEQAKECCLIQFMDETPPRDLPRITLECLCLKWSTITDEVFTMTTQKEAEQITEKGGNDDVTPWFGFIQASSTLSRVHVVRTNFTIIPFWDSLYWTFHRFVINCFYNNEMADNFFQK